MKKFAKFFPVFVLFLLIAVCTPGLTHTAYASCGGGCLSYTYWNGNTYGLDVVTQVSNPTLSNSNASYEWYTRLGNGSPRLFVGYVKNKGTGAGSPKFCANGGAALQYFVYAWNSSNTNFQTDCFAASTSDFNQNLEIQVYPDKYNDCNTSPEQSYIVFRINGNTIPEYTDCTNNGSSSPNVYNRMEYDVIIADSPSSGEHEVYGVQNLYSSYVDINANFIYQHRSVDATHNAQPPQIFWPDPPNSTNQGGISTSCVYNAIVTFCSIGG